jgi:hypothetical protein
VVAADAVQLLVAAVALGLCLGLLAALILS